MSNPFAKFGPRVQRVKATANITAEPLRKFKTLTDEQIMSVGNALLVNKHISNILTTTKKSSKKVEEAFAELDSESTLLPRELYLNGFIIKIMSLIGVSQGVSRDVTLFYTSLNESIDEVLAEGPGGGAGSAPPSSVSASSSSAPSSSVSAPSSSTSANSPKWTENDLKELGSEEKETELGGGARKRKPRRKTKRSKRSKKTKRRSRK